MKKFQKIRDYIQSLRSEQLQKKEELYLLQQEIDRLQSRMTRTIQPDVTLPTKGGTGKGRKPAPGKLPGLGGLTPGGGLQNPTPLDPIATQLKLLNTAKAQLVKRLQEITTLLLDAFNQLWTLGDPQTLVENWEDAYPALLLPVRIETRFLSDDVANQKYLGVRFFPDDIFVNTHEKALTAEEIEAGKIFWIHLWNALGSPAADREEAHKAAWRALATGMGGGRAAYIALKLRPDNWPTDENLLSLVRPVFPNMRYKNGSWSLPPRSYLLPDKFVVRLYSGAGHREVNARQITAYPLTLGPDPGSEETFFEENNGVLKVDPAIKWLFDFDKAVEEGMAVKIPITLAEYNAGFDKILVLGLRLTSDAAEGQNLCQELIDCHHYGLTGFALLPQGTPTNNTKEKPSGFSGLRPDPEFSFRVERQANLIADLASTPQGQWKDGQWLSFALGVNESHLQHIASADHTDRQEAAAMNKVLWPATLGYYLKHLLAHWANLDHNTISLTEISDLKGFFVRHISGRGSLSAFRVGNQPYGVLPISAYSRMKWDAADRLADKIGKTMRFFLESWKKKTGGVKTASNGSSNWQQDFMDILGLQAGSVEFHQRIGIGPLLFYQFLTNISASNPTPATWFNNKLNAANLVNTQINNLIGDSDLLAQLTREAMLNWFPFENKITGDLVTPDPLSEEAPLRNDYIQLLSDPGQTVNIVKNYLNGAAESNTLLFRLLRHALLLEVWEILWERDNSRSWVDKEFLNLLPDSSCDSIWYFYANKEGYLSETAIAYLNGNSRYQEFLTAAGGLLNGGKSLPTARLERLLTEHLDLCTYRMDAWLTGLADYRLNKMRSATPKGTFLGAYGWLLDVRKDPPRQVVPNVEIPSQLSNAGQTYPLTYETGNAGFIHALSIAQATTGAVLRQGYLSKGRKAMEVNISSKRVRLAREIIQGLRNGQELGALLGYRFERSLHEKSAAIAGLELDKYIYPLRIKFPLSAEADMNRQEAVESNNVIHGLNLVQTYRTGGSSIQNFTTATGNDLLEMHKSIDELEDIIDAIADLTMAEGVHQTILGNHARAGALLNSVGEGKNIPEPDFIETPRSGIALTQRVGLLFNTVQPAADPWAPTVKTPRAIAAPYLNAWAGRILGDPALVRCKVSYIENAGTDNELEYEEEIALKDLYIQPLDIVFLLNSPLEDGHSELAQRIASTLRTKKTLTRNIQVKIDFRNRDGWPLTVKTFYEILPLARSLYKILTDSQVMMPDHLQNASSLDTAAEITREFDLTELEARISLINMGVLLDNLSNQLAIVSATTDYTTTSGKQALDQLRRHLLKASCLGISGSIPPSFADFDGISAEELKAQAARVVGEMQKRWTKVTGQLAHLSPEPEKKLEELTQILKVILGNEIPILPKFKTNNFDALNSCYSARETLLRNAKTPLVMEDWLQGAAKVREKLKNWHLYTLLEESMGAQQVKKDFTALQLPFQVNDQWLGIEFEEDKINIAGDPLSLVLNLPDGFPGTADAFCCGLVLDEWTEKIPYRTETTGIAFNYDEPQAEPPQALLLAIPPEITGKWTWEDLMDTLNETLDTAKMRAIDPDLLGVSPGSEFNPFLPGLLSAISSDRWQTVALNFGEVNANNLS